MFKPRKLLKLGLGVPLLIFGARLDAQCGKISPNPITGQLDCTGAPQNNSYAKFGSPNVGVTNTTAALDHPVDLQVTGTCCSDFAHTNNFNEYTWIQFGVNYRIRQTGYITSIRFSWGNPTTTNQHTSLKLVICHPSNSSNTWISAAGSTNNPGECAFSFSSNMLSSLTSGAINTVTISPSIWAQEGDYYGFQGDGTFNTAGAIDDRFVTEAPVNTGVSGAGVAIGVPGSFPTINHGVTTAAIPVDIIMSTAPNFVAIGDSVISGSGRYPVTSGIFAGGVVVPPDPMSQIAYYINRYTGWTGQNVGVSGQTSTQISSRFTADVVNHSPRFVIIEGGVNDVNTGGMQSVFNANWTSMLTAAQAAGIIPVCLLMTPWTGGSNTNNATRDTWNASINGQCETFGGFTVDTGPYVGQFRTGQTAGNLWDIRPEYLYQGDNLGIHFNAEGYRIIARAILDRLGIINGSVPNRRPAVGSLEFYSQTGSISTTNLNCREDYGITNNGAVCEPGMYRVSLDLEVITGGAAATIVGTIGWNSPNKTSLTDTSHGGVARTASTSSLDASTTNFLSQQFVLQSDANGFITFATTLTNSATYNAYVNVEKIR